MKALAYTLYVVIVLLISGLARANAMTIEPIQVRYETPVQIGQVAVNSSQSTLQISGTLPNPCYGGPSALLVKESENVIVLRLLSPSPTNTCISQVKPFITNLVLAYLATASQVAIEAGTVYTLKVDGSEFQMQVPGSALIMN